MKKGLVMEGGSMRGLFTAGVTDVMMENGIEFDGAIGVSAGAAFGCNYKSRQPGRALRYNKRFARDPRFCSWRSLITTGDIFNAEFAYHILPGELDIFDGKAFEKNPMEFYLVSTDVHTGKAVYHRMDEVNDEELEWMRSSASMPLVSRIVHVGGYDLLDGGVADSIPLRHFEEIGYRRNVVILTQPRDFIKKKNQMLPAIRLRYGKKYPEFVRAVATRHIRYNRAVRYAWKEAEKGRALIIQPDAPLNIPNIQHDPDELQRVYDIGRRIGEEKIKEIRAFLSRD